MSADIDREKAAAFLRETIKLHDEWAADRTAQAFGTPYKAWLAAKYPCEVITARATPSPAPIQQAEPVRYEQRMRAPNGHCAPWIETDAEMHERYTNNPDIGDGFTYETRALIVAPLAPTVKAIQSDTHHSAKDDQ